MINQLQKIVAKERILENVAMANYTTFRTGGIADIVICPENKEELANILAFLSEIGSSYYILGNGSNLLVSDDGIRKPVIYIGKNFSEVEVSGEIITANAGAMLSSVARKAADNMLTGFEFAAGIPGTVGGALIMNAGAYGGEMKDVVKTVTYLDQDGAEHTISGEEMEFSYRKSKLSDSGCVILETTIKLSMGNKREIDDKMSELAAKRREKQPLEFPSAGSTFKRPEGYFAGTLIESSGLKGKTIGGAQVSEKHAGFIINKGGATSSDVLKLINYVKETVYEKHGVTLEPEVKYWD